MVGCAMDNSSASCRVVHPFSSMSVSVGVRLLDGPEVLAEAVLHELDGQQFARG